MQDKVQALIRQYENEINYLDREILIARTEKKDSMENMYMFIKSKLQHVIADLRGIL